MQNTSSRIDPKLNIYTSEEYFDAIIAEISATSTGDEVILVSMTFDPAKKTVRHLLAELGAAGKRGVKARLIIDARVFLYQDEHGLGPLFYSPKLPSRLPKRYDLIRKALYCLKECSVDYNIINIPARSFTNPHGGRCHIKFTLINDSIYFGGANLDNDANIDLMVGLQDADFANYLREFAAELVARGNVRKAMHDTDALVSLGLNSKVLIDAGVPNQSLIFENAIQLIKSAREHIFITCQHFPSGAIGRHLLEAHKRGVRIDIYSNHPNKSVWPYNILHYGAVQLAKRQLPKNFFENTLMGPENYLHAKLIATEQGAMVGSHNYLGIGVKFGTAEMTLINHDPDFSREAIDAVMKQMLPGNHAAVADHYAS
jgi:phosphatidylserine/phosphatidylglycerophosphate/cardiolipin synthase-like enzyme